MLRARAGTITTFIVGGVLGGIVFSKNFTIRKEKWFFSTDDDEHSFQRLEENYRTRVDNLKSKSIRALKDLKSCETTKTSKEEIIRTTVRFYLVPTWRDKLFGKDIVLFNEKDTPMIMSREDFYDVQNIWTKILGITGIRRCVDKHVIEQTHSTSESKSVENACKECLTNETLTTFFNAFPDK